MKNCWLKFASAVLFLAVLPSQVVHAVQVTFYNDKNFSNFLFESFSYEKVAEVSGSRNDKVSSAFLSQDVCLIMYEHKNFQGRWIMVTSDGYNGRYVSDVLQNNGLVYSQYDMDLRDPNHFNDRMTSYMILPRVGGFVIGVPPSMYCPVALMFEHNTHGGGYHYPVPYNHLFTHLGWFSDKASSVEVPSSSCLKLWNNAPPITEQQDPVRYYNWYDNPSRKLSAGFHRLDQLSPSLNDRVTAVELVHGNCN
ncbi:MAG TPA: hypothetical protein VL995_19780 [Cellvibrio sp.]|nr:hypothetical protein [Cellvibrio sp.]